MILIIDNYDSFTYNLAQYIGELGRRPVVYRNDKISLAKINRMNPSHIILSPGPCTPLEAGISNDVISCYGGKIPILGVCLGHQCIGYVYGGKIVRAAVPTHGKSSLVFHDGKTIYRNIPNPLEGGRYHSLIIERETLPSSLVITSSTRDNVIMGVRHIEYAVEGVQFHPESIMSVNTGHELLLNFLKINRPVWDPKK